MSVLAITGVAGHLGSQLLAQAEVDDEVEKVLGVDVAPPGSPTSKLAFVEHSVAEPFDDLFVAHKVDTAVHLAFVGPTQRDRRLQETVNVGGTRAFLSACHAAGVRTVCVRSSAAAYGARPDNPDFLYEGAPLRATPACPSAFDCLKVEELCYDFAREHPDTCVQIVRPCTLVGARADNALTRLLDRSAVPAPWGYDPPLQLLHVDDATRAIYRLLKLRSVGVFNLAPDGYMTLSRMARLAEKRLVRLPVLLLRLLMWLGWRLGLTGLSEVPPGCLDALLHPCLAAGIKLKTEALFLFRFDTSRALLDHLESRAERGPGALEPPKVDTNHDDDEGEDEELDDEDVVEDGASPDAAAAEPAGPAAPPEQAQGNAVSGSA